MFTLIIGYGLWKKFIISEENAIFLESRDELLPFCQEKRIGKQYAYPSKRVRALSTKRLAGAVCVSEMVQLFCT